ncbi:helix-turn-helix domain-containing protein [Streptomyces fuscichromogenes]|uniref:helix-turn-helix domain-containing protein n=1 Tax=Streptomyces fuscichromogenes TaxID=1324013 RepID=UPI0037FEA73F
MRALLLRLSRLDADTENSVRVVTFFDELTANRTPLPAVLDATARLAECPVGVADAGLGVCLRSDGERTAAVTAVPETAAVRELSVGCRVWLERTGPALPLDGLLLERFALTVAPLLDPARGEPLPRLGDVALLELAMSRSAAQAERARALRLLGYEPTTPLHALAVKGTADETKCLLAALRERGFRVRSADLGAEHAVLTPRFPGDAVDDLPPGIAVGVGPALPAADTPSSWEQARTALRFARTGSSASAVVRAGQLGALAALARLSARDIAEIDDVKDLDRLLAEPGGAELLAVLEAFCATGSTRKAAAEVHRHHSTVAARLGHAETILGFPLAEPQGRTRLELALVLQRLRGTAE